MAEIEGKGLDYERFALRKLFRRMVEERGIRSVLEIPARGEKAMPSIYSIALAEAGCEVTLVNPQPKSMWAWQELDLPVRCIEVDRLEATGLESGGWDLVWNFMQLSQVDDKAAQLDEMVRLSRRWVMFVAVNRFNPGFFSHRAVHRINQVPWTHGDVAWMNPYHVRRIFRERGLNVARTGAVDTPPYPDSLGFRDMRLHRMNVDLHEIDWDSRTIHWMKQGQYPLKLSLLYFFEWLPLPLPLKLLYAHLYYVLAEVPAGRR